MFCNNCGKEIGQNSKFCNYCGSGITTPKVKETSESKKEQSSVIETETVWTCDYCGKEFDTKSESDTHEKTCPKNPINSKMSCLSCGADNLREATFCKKCGDKLGSDKNKKNIIQSTLDEKDERYKKIKNAGSTAEALGWFNIILSPILILINNAELESGYFIFDLIYVVVVSIIFIKFGKKLKKVICAKMSDVNILLVLSIIVVGINILSGMSDGKFVGLLYFFEIFYLLKARSTIKSLTV